MPFQDIDDEGTAPIQRPPSMIERWARKILLEDWGLKLMAVAITAVLWLAVTGQNEPKTLRIQGVQLDFLKQKGLEISNDPPGSVEVILTGSPEKLKEIGAGGLLATVDVRDQNPGERVVRLSTDRVRMDLPPGVKIQSFQPGTISLRLESRLESQVEVEIKLEGKVPEGYEITGFSANPARVRVSGPSDHVNALRKAMTETVSLNGKTESFSLSNVAINISDPKIDLLDPNVNVRVEISEKKRSDAHITFATADSSLYLARIITLSEWL
jgi:YbbR domain-containing protein